MKLIIAVLVSSALVAGCGPKANKNTTPDNKAGTTETTPDQGSAAKPDTPAPTSGADPCAGQ